MHKNDLIVEEYTLKLKGITNNLVAIEEVVTKRDLILYRLRRFNYNAFISSMLIPMRTSYVTFGEFQSELMLFDKRLIG